MPRSTLPGAITAVLGLVMMTGCAPGDDSGADEAAGPSADDIETDLSELGDITLTVWDQEVRGAQNDAIEALIGEFEDEHPNITIDRVSQSFDDLQQQAGLALSGDDVPDVMQVNNARSDMGEFVSSGELTDLSGYAEVYEWEDRFPESVLSKTRYSEDAETFGEGALWGLPQTGEVVGIFYSEEAFDELGLEPPETWDDLYDIVDQAGSEGERPLVLGNIEGWPALHVFGALQSDYVPADQIVELGMGNAGADWTSEENLEALEQMESWAEDGAFGDSPNGEDYDAAWESFTRGNGTLLIGGSWLGPDMAQVMDEDVRFMAPPAGTGDQIATTGGTGIPFAVPSGAENPDAAAAFIDYIVSDEAMELIADNGGLPVLNAGELAPDSGVNKDIYEAFDTVSTEGVLLPYLDYATPTFADTAADNLQELIGGQISADEAAENLQEDYAQFTEQD